MAAKKIRETELYEPVKNMLEGQGYEVKGEIGAADLVAVKPDEDPIVVELKTGFSLTLFHQAIERQSLTDWVYVAVPRGPGKAFLKALKNNKSLCRRLGVGLIVVRLKDGHTEIVQDPAPYQPRKSKQKKGRLLREFEKLVGDPNTGGSTRQNIMTAYRQDAIRCLHVLASQGALKASIVSKESGVDVARRIMADNHYGWFEKVKLGVYDLSPKGRDALKDHPPSP